MILDKLGLDGSLRLKKPIRGLNGYTLYELVSSLISYGSVPEAAMSLGYSDNPIKQSIRQYLLPIIIKQDSRHWRNFLLSIISYKHCSVCYKVQPVTAFHKDVSQLDNLSKECGSCKCARTKYDKEELSLRVVPWTDKLAIREFYNNCPKDMVVDHYRPLRGRLVSGLHVLSNLRYMTRKANLLKSNKFEVSDEV